MVQSDRHGWHQCLHFVRRLRLAIRRFELGSDTAEKQTFWNDFFNVFGIQRRLVATFEKPVKKISGDYQSASYCPLMLFECQFCSPNSQITKPPISGKA
jgi:hypothetical protein